MSDFNEFDQQGSVPARETGSIISHAFEMYKGVFLYALLAIVISFVASWIIQLVSGFDSQEMYEEIVSSGDYTKINFWAMPGMVAYSGLSALLSLLMAPLYVGVIYIANKYNNKERIQASDLFIGYKQNFINILLYSIVSGLILGIAFSLCVIPGFLVLPLLLIGYPILLFENASVGEALSKSYNIAKENYGTFLGTSLLGFLISIAGIVLCFIGVYLTIYFMLVVMYSAYVAFVGKPRPLLNA